MQKNIKLVIKVAASVLTVISLIGCSGPAEYSADETTPRTVAVNEQETGSNSLENVSFNNESLYFNLNVSSNTTSNVDSLASLAKKLKENNIKVNVNGHADERGSEQVNDAIAMKRANTIATTLVKFGVPKENINVVSYGKSKPLFNGHDENSWKMNRRVDIVKNA